MVEGLLLKLNGNHKTVLKFLRILIQRIYWQLVLFMEIIMCYMLCDLKTVKAHCDLEEFLDCAYESI